MHVHEKTAQTSILANAARTVAAITGQPAERIVVEVLDRIVGALDPDLLVILAAEIVDSYNCPTCYGAGTVPVLDVVFDKPCPAGCPARDLAETARRTA